jgi:hypothetical protein
MTIGARCRSQRQHFDLLDAHHEAVANLRTLDSNGRSDFVTATEMRGNHRPPATRRRLGHNHPAISDRAVHGLAWPNLPPRIVGNFDMIAHRIGNSHG